jgi:hypothetical protein
MQLTKELKKYFDQELQAYLPLTVLPNGDLSYPPFLIIHLNNGNWGIVNALSKDLIDQFFLKSCALIATKSYAILNLSQFHEIKNLDSLYWSHYQTFINLEKTLNDIKDYDQYQIVLNKLEHNQIQADMYKQKISKIFRLAFL